MVPPTHTPVSQVLVLIIDKRCKVNSQDGSMPALPLSLLCPSVARPEDMEAKYQVRSEVVSLLACHQ